MVLDAGKRVTGAKRGKTCNQRQEKEIKGLAYKFKSTFVLIDYNKMHFLFDQ